MMASLAKTVLDQYDSGTWNSEENAGMTRSTCLQTASTIPFDNGTYEVENRCFTPIAAASTSITSFLK